MPKAKLEIVDFRSYMILMSIKLLIFRLLFSDFNSSILFFLLAGVMVIED